MKLATIIDLCAVNASSFKQFCNSQCKSLEFPYRKSWVTINDLMSLTRSLGPVCLISEPDIIACSCSIVHINLIRLNFTAKQNSAWFYYFTLFEINLNLSHKSQVCYANVRKPEGKKLCVCETEGPADCGSAGFWLFFLVSWCGGRELIGASSWAQLQLICVRQCCQCFLVLHFSRKKERESVRFRKTLTGC